MKKFFAGTAVILMWTTLAAGQTVRTKAARPCTRDQAIAAEQDVDHLPNWNAVYGSFKRYGQCDDGAIGEGYSDAIAQLLAHRWDQFEQLRRLAARSKPFRRFVLHHVDELMTQDEAALIEKNARLNCPEDGKVLCSAILAKIRE